MKMLTMAYKYYIVVLLFGLNLWPTLVASEPQHSTLSGKFLIEKACRGLGSFKKECMATLMLAPDHEKIDVNGLALYTLRYIGSNVDKTITTSFKGFAKESNLSPNLQKALKNCNDQYLSLDDLVKHAINVVQAKAYPDAKKFINTAISNVDHFDDGVKQDHFQDQIKEKSAEDVASVLKEINLMIRYHLSAALNIFKAHK